MPTAMIALIAVWPTRMTRFSWVKNDGDRTENIPMSTNRAINALSRKRRTPNDRPEESLALRGSLGGEALAEDSFMGKETIKRFPLVFRGMVVLLACTRRENERFFRYPI